MNKKSNTIINIIFSILAAMILSIIIFASINKKKYKHNKVLSYKNFTVPKKESIKQDYIFYEYKNYTFGIDFSHYQGEILWDSISKFNNNVKISFVVMRATMGKRKKDKYFTYNWQSAKQQKIIRGAYHYYRPNENSTKQAQNFINRVKLQKGDLPPILDIEKKSKIQSIKSLKIGLKNWLDIVEKHYGVKAIIYSGDKFYNQYLSGNEFENYTIWIANYNDIKQPKTKNWKFWQFSDKGTINGVNEYVDLNVFNNKKYKLKELLIK